MTQKATLVVVKNRQKPLVLIQSLPLSAHKSFSKKQSQHLIGSGFCCQMGHINAKSNGSLRIIVLSNQHLPQRVWASAQQSLSKLAFAFALHHICTLPETTLVTTKRLQVYPRDSTKTPPTASIERGDGKASFCRRQKVGLPSAIFEGHFCYP